MTIGIIGADGFIGKYLVQVFKSIHHVIKITRKDYDSYHRAKFDCIINANGNSRKFWANKHPEEDFKASVESVYNSTRDFRFSKYIYLSSRDAEQDKIQSIYGYNKFIAEKIVKKYCRDYSIVRLPSVIGLDSKKGVVHDIWHGNEVYLSPESTLMLMSAQEIAEQLLFNFDELEPLERFYPSMNITIEQIGGILCKEVKYALNGAHYYRHELYNVNGRCRQFKTSGEYLKTTYDERME